MSHVPLIPSRDAVRGLLRKAQGLLHWHWRAFYRLLLLAAVALALLAATWQFYFIPRLETFRPTIERKLSEASGSRITLARLAGGWRGIRPHLAIHGVVVHAANGTPALTLPGVEADLSWWALVIGDVQFRRLTLSTPRLAVARDASGVWHVAGFSLTPGGGGDHRFLDWVLSQREVEIRGGELLWIDALHGNEPLALRQVELRLSRLFGRHRLQLGVTPPATLGGRLALSANWRGDGLARWAEWQGDAQLTLKQLDLGALAARWPGQPLPVSRVSGRLDGRLSVHVAAGRIDAADSDVLLQGLRWTQGDRRLTLPRFDGRLSWQGSADGRQLSLSADRIVAERGLACEQCTLHYSARGHEQQLQLAGWHIAPMLGYRPWLPAAWQQRLAPLSASGRVAQASLQWQDDLKRYKGEIRLAGASLGWGDVVTRLAGVDLETRFDERGGSAGLQSRQLLADLPRLFVGPLSLDRFELDGNWRRESGGWTVQMKRLALANDDVSLGASARYRYDGHGPGLLDLTGTIARLDAARVHAYLPRVIGEQTLAWLTGALKSGQAYDGRIRVLGPLAQFPFPNDAGGQFRITAKTRDVALDYAPGWPMLSGIAGELDFHGQRMDIRADRAMIGAVPLHDTRVAIPDLGAHEPHLLADGNSTAGTRDFLGFLRTSPLHAVTQAYVDGLKAQGQGELALKLDIPLHDTVAARVAGQYRFRDNALEFGGAVPPLTAASGEIVFTEQGLAIQDGQAQALGGTSRFSGAVQGGDFTLQLAGQAKVRDTWQRYGLPLAERVSGAIDYRGKLVAGNQGYRFEIDTPLTGARFDLPLPLAKPPGEARPLRLVVNGGGSGGREELELGYGKLLQLVVAKAGNDWRGTVGLGSIVPKLPDRTGIALVGGWPVLDLDPWLALASAGAGAGSGEGGVSLAGAQLVFDKVKAGGRLLSNVRFALQRQDAGWQGNLASDQADGRFTWRSANAGVPPLLDLKLSRLALPLAREEGERAADARAGSSEAPVTGEPQWPSLRLAVEDFRYENRPLGQLSIAAMPQAGNWRLNDVTLTSDDGELSLNGLWRRADARSRVSGRFEIKSPDFGRLLGRLGYPDTVRRAPGSFSGEVAWEGAPFPPDLATMQGSLKLDIAAGQFAKIDPGAARLLSVLSLQSLARRVKLDFRDVFSDGFEFDQIKGEATIEKGIARTQDLTIAGPGAQVLFKGEANIVAGTQNLRVRIVPVVGDTVAIAAGVVNPLAGVAAFLLQRALKDPIGNLIAYEYEITGSMRDPQVKRVRSIDNLLPDFGKPR